MVEAGTINKAVNIQLKRHKRGIKVKVQVWPEIEDFFKEWGGGASETARYGRLWKPAVEGGETIRLWSFDDVLRQSEETSYNLLNTGAGFFNEYGHINISFLRLVGASEPEGRSFIIEQVISRQELEKIGARVTKAAEQFYTNYIQSVNLSLYVGVMDMSRTGVIG